MTMADPVRVFVGCAPNGEDAESQAVLEYTLRKHASLPVEITWMRLSRDPGSFWFSDGRGNGWCTEDWATPFSGFRWAVPAACNFEGRAVYCDSDFIFMGDIAELWSQSFMPGKIVMRKAGAHGRFCICLWDCAGAHDLLPPLHLIRTDHRCAARACAEFLTQPFRGNWNCLDGEGLPLDHPTIRAIHYTDMSCQPHLGYARARLAAAGQQHWYDGAARPHPRKDLQHLFDRLLAEAIAAGYTLDRYVPAQLYGPIAKRELKSYRGMAHAV